MFSILAALLVTESLQSPRTSLEQRRDHAPARPGDVLRPRQGKTTGAFSHQCQSTGATVLLDYGGDRYKCLNRDSPLRLSREKIKYVQSAAHSLERELRFVKSIAVFISFLFISACASKASKRPLSTIRMPAARTHDHVASGHRGGYDEQQINSACDAIGWTDTIGRDQQKVINAQFGGRAHRLLAER